MGKWPLLTESPCYKKFSFLSGTFIGLDVNVLLPIALRRGNSCRFPVFDFLFGPIEYALSLNSNGGLKLETFFP